MARLSPSDPAILGDRPAELASRQQPFLDLVQGLDAIVWEMDAASFAFTFVSQRAEHLLGYPVQRWLDEPGFWQNTLLHPEDRQWAFEFCSAATREARDHELEYRVVRADGGVVWLRDRVRVEPGTPGSSPLLRGVMIDVTREKLALDRLIEREAQLAEAQALAGLGSWDWDIPSDRITWSDEQFRLHGREPLPAIDYQWFFSHVHPDDQGWLAERMQRSLATGEPFEFPYRIVRGDGALRHLYARGKMIMSAEGKPLRMIGTSQDISGRVEAEERIRTSEESYRTVFDASNDAIFIHDLETGAILDANRRACEPYGVGLDELRARGLELIGSGPPPFTRERALELIRRAAEGHPQRFEWCTPHPQTGEPMWVEVSLQRVSILGQGRLLAMVRDIRERKRVEQELRASEESYRTIFQLAGAAIWVHDIDTLEFLEVNQTACDLYGYTLEETKALGVQGLTDGRPPYDLEHAQEYIRRALAGEPQRLEWLGRHKNGGAVWAEITIRRVTIQGVDRLLVTGRDIQERKAAEAELRRAYEQLERRVEERTAQLAQSNRALEQEIAEHEAARRALQASMEAAERASRAKSEFLSRMSHELRTPMNSILGFAQLLERTTGLSPHDVRSVQHILKAGRHLLQLINEVLEISRIEAGRHHLSLEPVRIGSVLQEAVGLVRPLAAQREVDLEEGPWALGECFVRADRQRLVQVLLNLLSNAIKYNQPGGRVRLSCEALAGADGASGQLRVRVADSGRGIPEEQIDQLFTPFTRLGSEQAQIEGTGLGLALSQRLADAMGGSLELESTGAAGSVFRLELQLAESPLLRLEEAEAARASALDERAHAPATLLYVEDNLANLSLVETILLSRPRWRTVPALQGQLGLELAREHCPDLILLDLHLPDISGEEVLRRLRTDPRTAAIPVVIISADATRTTIDRLRSAGADAFVTKPLDIDTFLSTLERFLPADDLGE